MLAWFSVYGAVEPTTGARFFLELPYLKAASFPLCVHAFAEAFPDSLTRLLLDHSGAHPAQRLTLPAHVRLVCLPPYGPELHPIARGWRDLKDALAWRQCPHLDVQHDDLMTLLQGDQAATRQSLTDDTSLVEAVHALCP